MFAPLSREGHGARSRATLIVGALLICVWQWSLAPYAEKTSATYRVTAASGINQEARAFFFLRHLGVFPLMTRAVIREDTRAEAERLVREHPGELVMDEGSTFRSGDRGRTFLYWVDAIWRGRALLPSLVPAHALAFVLGLCSLWAGAWWSRRPVLGALLVALVGSNPWQLYAVYAQENVFSWPITTFALTLGLCFPLIAKGPVARWYPWFVAALLALVLATIRTVRSEPVMLALSVALVLLSQRSVSLRHRLAMIALMAALFAGTNKIYDALFIRGVSLTNQWVQRVGATPYNGPVRSFHEVWHALYCGLGDFDKTYGYKWDDTQAFRYAYPFLRARHGDRYRWDTTINYFSNTYDSAGKYPIFWSEVPGYHEVIRDKVVGDIKAHPGWFATILLKRAGTIVTDTTPLSFAIGEKRFDFESKKIGPVALLFALCMAARRRWRSLLIVAFALPLSSQALIVYAFNGMTYYGCFHLVIYALVAYASLRYVAKKVTERASPEERDAPSEIGSKPRGRVRLALASVASAACAGVLVHHLVRDRVVPVRASGMHTPPYHPRMVLDDDLNTHWFLPDLRLGWIELRVASGRVRSVKVWNVHNNAFHCTNQVSLELRQGARVVTTVREDLGAYCNTGRPFVFTWPSPVEADAVRINVESFTLHGVGLSQVRVE